MFKYPNDVYTEPTEVDPDTLKNLGPLRAIAGNWRSAQGIDVNPKAEGPRTEAYVDRVELQPIDPQTNGPQLYYGLRYHQHIVKPGEVETFHDQVGYWLWEPATGTVIQTVAIPAVRRRWPAGFRPRTPGNSSLRPSAARRSRNLSNPFLEDAFRTLEYRIKVSVHSDGRWSYDQTTLLAIKGSAEPFRHHDTNTFVKVGDPTPNPS